MGLGFVCRCQDYNHLEGSRTAGKTGHCSQGPQPVGSSVSVCAVRGSVDGLGLKGRKRQALGLLKTTCSGKNWPGTCKRARLDRNRR